MENKNNIPYILFAKFFSSEITEKEQTELNNFIAENPGHEKIFKDYELIWSTESSSDNFEDKTEQALKKVKSNFNKELKSEKNNIKIIYRIAAAVIIVFGLTYLGNEFFFKKETEYFKLVSSNELIKKELPDGSTVWLNKNSTLIYPEKFVNNERRVKFSGEAYFKIAHNKDMPFKIESQNTETKVLGTEFNLRSHDTEEYIELTLIEGKVQFTDYKTEESKTLEKNEIIKLNKNKRELIKNKITYKNHLYWKTKEINLDGLNLEEIASELNAIFNINIVPDESVKELRYYQSLPFKDNDLHEILDIIKFTLSLKIDTLENTIFLKQ